MNKKRIIILGAGLAGLSAAWHLKNRGYSCDLFEKEREAGGLCRSKDISGFTFDCDGHLLHFRHSYTKRFVQGLLNDNIREHKRSAWVYSYKKFLPYPFQAHLYGLPARIVRECVVGFLGAVDNANMLHGNGDNFRSWINKRFGKGIARNFLIPYNKKFWTVPPKYLASEWVDGFIPQPSVGQVISGSIGESCDGLGYNARFFYPKNGGINCLPQAISSNLENIYLDSAVTAIDLKKKEITINSRQKENFDYLISTIPLPEIPSLIKGLPGRIKKSLNDLKWNSIFNLNLGLEGKIFPEKHWVYFAQKDTCFFRVGFPANFSAGVTPSGSSSLYAEVSYSDRRPIDKSKIPNKIKSDLNKIGVKAKNLCAEDYNDIKYGYPIYDKNYRQSRETALGYLAKHDIIGCGRYGSWKYMSMEDAILDGKRVAEGLISR